jgi:hypothetical protein
MGGAGLSKPGLDRLHEVMAGHVTAGRVPGLVLGLARRGDVHINAVGTAAARQRRGGGRLLGHRLPGAGALTGPAHRVHGGLIQDPSGRTPAKPTLVVTQAVTG